MASMGVAAGQPIAVSSAGAPVSSPPPAPGIPLDNHGSSGVGSIGGPIDALLDQNYAILNQFKSNMAAYKASYRLV